MLGLYPLIVAAYCCMATTSICFSSQQDNIRSKQIFSVREYFYVNHFFKMDYGLICRIVFVCLAVATAFGMKVGGPNLTIALLRHQLFGPLEPHPIALPHRSIESAGCSPVRRCPALDQVPDVTDCQSHGSPPTTNWIPYLPLVYSLSTGPDNSDDRSGTDMFLSLGPPPAENSLGNLLDLFA